MRPHVRYIGIDYTLLINVNVPLPKGSVLRLLMFVFVDGPKESRVTLMIQPFN